MISRRLKKTPTALLASKSSRRALASKAHPFKNIRRAFRGFSTEEAWTFVVKYNGKRRFCRMHRTQNSQPLANRYKLVLDLFHRLYPKNSLTPVGLMKIPANAVLSYYPEEFAPHELRGGDPAFIANMNKNLERRKKGMHKFPLWGVVTEIERRQSHEFKVYQTYVRGFARREPRAAQEHNKFVQSIAWPLADKIFKESGIRVDYAGNMSNVGGNPLYFEPKITSPQRLIEFIKTKPVEERQKLMQIIRSLGFVQ